MERRKFLCSCGAVALIGISVPASGHLISRRRKGFRCGVIDPMSNAAIGKQKWDREHFRYYVAGRDTEELTEAQWDGELKLAFDSWSEVTPLTFEQVPAGGAVDLVISAGQRRREGFGSSGGVLAWAQLPPTRNFDGTLISKFDVAENWVLPDSSEELGIVFRAVAAHEIGHLLGLSHSGDPDSLMWPYITSAMGPKPDDIKKIQRLYGKPRRAK
jgi:predicted Zn-dependent protease